MRVYLKIPENFERFIVQDGFWVVHTQIVYMVKFQFLTQFPVDQLPDPVLSSFIMFFY